MRIKSLKLAGFKSFNNPANIHFKQNGISIIVGPNGCGKSNVVDAIRWVLGEQSAKHLRGGSMVDVIFAGSVTEKPAQQAEVTLTFSLDQNESAKYGDFKEISVTRRLNRSGQSVYLINKMAMRLSDVRELFMDTGVGGKAYSIIEQGKVDEITTAKPTDRRAIIEDAAGIVKYKLKKKNAEKRLMDTLGNLTRVDDVLDELSKQEVSLRGQMEKAKLFLTTKNDLEQLDKDLCTLKWINATLKHEKSENNLNKFNEEKQSLIAKKTVEEDNLQDYLAQQSEEEKELTALKDKQHKTEKDIADLNNEIKIQDQSVTNYRNWIDKNTGEVYLIEKKLVEKQAELTTSNARLDELKNDFERMDEAVEIVEEQKSTVDFKISENDDKTQSNNRKLLGIHTEITNINNNQYHLLEKSDSLGVRKTELEEQSSGHSEVSKKSHNQANQSQAKVTEIKLEIEDITEHIDSLKQQLIQLNETLDEKALTQASNQSGYNLAVSELHSLEEIQNRQEDFNDGLKSFMSLMKENPEIKEQMGIIGVMAEHLTIQPDYIKKAGILLSDFLEWVIIKDAKQFSQIENYCSEHDISRINFIALNRQPIAFKTIKSPQGIALKDVVEFSPQSKSLSTGLFALVYLNDDPKTFSSIQWDKSIGIYEWVSPNQNYFTRYGSAKIGKNTSSTLGYLSRQSKISELKISSEALKNSLTIIDKEVVELKEQQLNIEEQLQTDNAELHELELELLKYRKELEHDLEEQDRLNQLMGQLESDLKSIDEEKTNIKNQLIDLDAKLIQLQKDREELEANIKVTDSIQSELEEQSKEISETLIAKRVGLTETIEQLKNFKTTVERLENETSEHQQHLEQLNKSSEEFENKLSNSSEEKRALLEAINESDEKLKEIAKKIVEQSNQFSELSQNKAKMSKSIKTINESLEKLTQKIHTEDLRLTEHKLHAEAMEQQLQNDYEMHPKQLKDSIEPDKMDEKEMATQLRSLKGRVNSMKNVNLAAPDEYDDLKERLDFISQQSSDLHNAVDDLKKTIKEINLESKKRFKETFDKVNENFKMMFRTVFGGGEAYMKLTEGDVLEAGIEIVAQPPGKRLQNMMLLSGGEKALTAISLIFAIFQLKPSPFCLLDEVDAPLDDANVVRFNNMVQKMTANSQFIIITHNKKTMEIGEYIYGVTMQDPGVSKLVSVKFEEAEALAF